MNDNDLIKYLNLKIPSIFEWFKTTISEPSTLCTYDSILPFVESNLEIRIEKENPIVKIKYDRLTNYINSQTNKIRDALNKAKVCVGNEYFTVWIFKLLEILSSDISGGKYCEEIIKIIRSAVDAQLEECIKTYNNTKVALQPLKRIFINICKLDDDYHNTKHFDTLGIHQFNNGNPIVITLYHKEIDSRKHSCSYEENYLEVFAHELFHAIHTQNKHLITGHGFDTKDKITVESLASYFEKSFCDKYIKDTQISGDLKNSWIWNDKSYFPYAGAKEIISNSRFNMYYEQSLLDPPTYPLGTWDKEEDPDVPATPVPVKGKPFVCSPISSIFDETILGDLLGGTRGTMSDESILALFSGYQIGKTTRNVINQRRNIIKRIASQENISVLELLKRIDPKYIETISAKNNAKEASGHGKIKNALDWLYKFKVELQNLR